MESTILASPNRVWNTGTIRQVQSRPHIYMHAYMYMLIFSYAYMHTYIHTCRPSICGIASRSMSFFWFALNPKTFGSASSTFEIQCKGNGRVGYPLPRTYLRTYVHKLTTMHLLMYAHNQLLSSILNIDVYVCMYVCMYYRVTRSTRRCG